MKLSKILNPLTPARSIEKALFGKNPADAASPYLQQIPGLAREMYDPYVSRGSEAGSQTQKIYSQMAENPMQYLDQIIAGYSPSKGFQFRRDEALKAMGSTAAAGGYRGGMYDQRAQGELASRLADLDMQQYINNILGIQGSGLTGQEGIAQRGFQAQSSLADALMGVLGSQAELGFQGARQKQMNRAALLGGLGQAAGAFAGFAGQPSASAFGKKLW